MRHSKTINIKIEELKRLQLEINECQKIKDYIIQQSWNCVTYRAYEYSTATKKIDLNQQKISEIILNL